MSMKPRKLYAHYCIPLGVSVLQSIVFGNKFNFKTTERSTSNRSDDPTVMYFYKKACACISEISLAIHAQFVYIVTAISPMTKRAIFTAEECNKARNPLLRTDNDNPFCTQINNKHVNLVALVSSWLIHVWLPLGLPLYLRASALFVL